MESLGVYTIQIAAMSLGMIFSGGTAYEILKYLYQYFPVIYETEASYNLTEVLIDDGNRVVLDNVAGDGGELYVYAPLEFEIYKDHEFTIGSGTLGRVIVYVHMSPEFKIPEKMETILSGLSDCEGEECI
jgi:hypothetical protein